MSGNHYEFPTEDTDRLLQRLNVQAHIMQIAKSIAVKNGRQIPNDYDKASAFGQIQYELGKLGKSQVSRVFQDFLENVMYVPDDKINRTYDNSLIHR